MAQGILRPLSYGDLFDELFDLYKKNFVLLVGIAAVIQVPIYAIAYAIGGEIASIIAGVINLLLSPFILAATTLAVSQRYLGNHTTIAATYRSIGRFIWPFILTMFVVQLFISIGSAYLMVPGIVLSFQFAFVAQVFILEGKGGGEGRDRSAFLVKGNCLRIFVVGLLAVILVYIIILIIQMPALFLLQLSGVNPQLDGGVIGMLFGIIDGIACALANPLQAMAMVLLYYDIRVRKEGFDIEMLAKNMGSALPIAASVPLPAGQETIA